MRAALPILALAAILCGGCNRGTDPYRKAGNPPGQNPNGTPSDRTGGARNVPDGAGGGPAKPQPADSK
jgi:hypothetical protein